eukprot:4471432-Alexandrium_andersonii.AAC.1
MPTLRLAGCSGPCPHARPKHHQTGCGRVVGGLLREIADPSHPSASSGGSHRRKRATRFRHSPPRGALRGRSRDALREGAQAGAGPGEPLSLIHISEPTRLALI